MTKVSLCHQSITDHFNPSRSRRSNVSTLIPQPLPFRNHDDRQASLRLDVEEGPPRLRSDLVQVHAKQKHVHRVVDLAPRAFVQPLVEKGEVDAAEADPQRLLFDAAVPALLLDLSLGHLAQDTDDVHDVGQLQGLPGVGGEEQVQLRLYRTTPVGRVRAKDRLLSEEDLR